MLGLAGCGTPSAAPRTASKQSGHAAGVPPRSTATPTAAAPAITVASGTVKPQKKLRDVAAVVNGEVVPMWEYHALLTLNTQAAGITATAPTVPELATVRARTARQIVDESLLNAYARTHGLAVSSRTVDARLAVYRLQGGAGFAASLAHLGVSAAEFRRLVERNLNAQAVTGRIVDAIAAPPAQVQVIQVVVPSRQRAQQIHDEVARGADPMLLAAQQSSDPYVRRLAGQLPPLTRARGDALFGANWAKAAFTVKAGQVSNPVQLNDGWAVIQVVEREPAATVMERTLSNFIDALRHGARITSYVD